MHLSNAVDTIHVLILAFFRHDMAIVVVKFSKKGFTARVSENIADGVKFTGNFIFHIRTYFVLATLGKSYSVPNPLSIKISTMNQDVLYQAQPHF